MRGAHWGFCDGCCTNAFLSSKTFWLHRSASINFSYVNSTELKFLWYIDKSLYHNYFLPCDRFLQHYVAWFASVSRSKWLRGNNDIIKTTLWSPKRIRQMVHFLRAVCCRASSEFLVAIAWVALLKFDDLQMSFFYDRRIFPPHWPKDEEKHKKSVELTFCLNQEYMGFKLQL
jgi:hypothetical protein